MRAESVEALEGREREDDDPAVGATSDKDIVRQLKLADERGVALEEGETFAACSTSRRGDIVKKGRETRKDRCDSPSLCRPDADGRVK